MGWYPCCCADQCQYFYWATTGNGTFEKIEINLNTGAVTSIWTESLSGGFFVDRTMLQWGRGHSTAEVRSCKSLWNNRPEYNLRAVVETSSIVRIGRQQAVPKRLAIIGLRLASGSRDLGFTSPLASVFEQIGKGFITTTAW